jgi:mono/diheme cytochrome c family protein
MRENLAGWRLMAAAAGGAALATALLMGGEDPVLGRATAGRIAAVERGRYLVATHGCGSCHTPRTMGPRGPRRDDARFLSGHPEDAVLPPAPSPERPWVSAGSETGTAFAGPWGVSYAANLTPDRNTGLGIWTEDMFVRAIRTGKHFGVSRPIQPPMPWGAFRNLTDEDLKAIFAYLRTVPPVTNHVPDWEPPAEAVAAK